MSAERLSFPACMLTGKNSISSSDVMLMRKYGLPNGITSWSDAHMLITVNRTCDFPSPEWQSYFVESLASFVVLRLQPVSVLTEAKGRWLQRLLAPSGVIERPLELDALLHIIEISAEVPVSLSAFALDQIRKRMVARAMDAADERCRQQGVSRQDLDAVWRVLRVAVDRGHVNLMPLERMVLLAMDALAPAEQHLPAWNEFVRALREQDRPINVSA